MRVGVTHAAMVMAVAQCCCVAVAVAETVDDGHAEPTLLFFSGGDAWQGGGFVHGGFLWSPAGLSNEGLTLKILLGSGLYRYRSGALGGVEVMGREVSGAAMPGWRFKYDNADLTIFAGLDAQDHRLFPDDPSSRLRGRHFGLRGGFDFWYQPSAVTMLALDASASSIAASYSARAAVGWRLFDALFVGPEAQAFACNDYEQQRFGLHMTGLKVGRYEFSAAVGHAWDSSDRSGAYARLGLILRR